MSFLPGGPFHPTRHRLEEAAGAALLTQAALVSALSVAKGGPKQTVALDAANAVAQLHAEVSFTPTLGGRPYPRPLLRDSPFLFAPYKTSDDRFVMPAAVYPDGVSAWLNFLGAPPREVASAIKKWGGLQLEERAAEAGLPISLCRSSSEWAAHPQGRLLARQPVIAVVPLEANFATARPAPPTSWVCRSVRGGALLGLRVLSFVRAVAGPIAGRTLAEQGADVLQVTPPEQFEHLSIWAETGVGQRSTYLDMKHSKERAKLDELVRTADVIIDNLRPGRLSSLGLGEEALVERNPNLIILKISAYGREGPWALRSGFDMSASAAVGIMHTDRDQLGPCLRRPYLMHDFLTGILGAAGVVAALLDKEARPGPHRVSVSLARTAMWLQSFGLHERVPTPDSFRGPLRAQTFATPYGSLNRLCPPVIMSHTPGAWRVPVLEVRGTSEARWLGARELAG